MSKVRLHFDLTEIQTRSVRNAIQHFHLLVHLAEGGAVAIAAGAGVIGADVYRAEKGGMAQFTDSSEVAVQLKLYGADGRLIEKIEKTR